MTGQRRAFHPMNRAWAVILLTLAVATTVAGTLRASPEADVLAALHQAVDSFNKGDTKGLVAACANEMSIIDEFPPYAWQGANVLEKYFRDYEAYDQQNGISEPAVKLGKPRHVDVVGDRAYVIVPTDETFKKGGKAMNETAATWTLTLRKERAGWKITGWAWARP